MTTSPSLSEYGVATAAVYTTTPPSGGQELPIIPAGSGLTLIRQSDPALLSDGFSAASFQDGNGNIIIAYEGTQIQRGTYNVPTAYTVGTGGADYVLGNGGTPQNYGDSLLNKSSFIDAACSLGFRPRLRSASVRPCARSRWAIQSASPSGRPIVSARRSAR